MPAPSEPRPPHDGPVLEPIRVLRPRRTDALAELMREFHRETGREPAPEPRALPAPQPGSEDETRELPPVGGLVGRDRGRGTTPATGSDSRGRAATARRRTTVAVAVLAAAGAGFAGALLVHGDHGGGTAAPAPRPPASAPAAAPTPAPTPSVPRSDPDGPGTLREGASGPEVTELQQRLLGIPDVYRDGSTSGRYDQVLTAAVARFQLWYGIRGDETGVYGNDTRAALESRTAPVTS
ncbi:peptidoglycan-binding protein [Streptomyces sp. NPDC017943]|uniref:peptidoglycan-binding protein n=1 Tax=Streptomyces sp. NPDC017943 TaxID=3365019 RepID=UPI0037AED948